MSVDWFQSGPLMDSLAHRKRIGAYDLGTVIGRGIAGTVFQATDPHAAGRPVAMKVLTLDSDDPDLLLIKFYREAKDTGSLQHPNIVTVHELGYEDGMPYVVMEYLQGVSLAALMAGRRSSLISIPPTGNSSITKLTRVTAPPAPGRAARRGGSTALR